MTRVATRISEFNRCFLVLPRQLRRSRRTRGRRAVRAQLRLRRPAFSTYDKVDTRRDHQQRTNERHADQNPPPATRVVWGTDCYIVPWSDGTVLVGATVEDVGFDERTTAAGLRGLLNAAVDLMPGLEHAEFREARAGLRPKTADELPAIGRSSTMPHVFYATGHYRNGVLLAPLTARLVADLVLEGKTDGDLAFLQPRRFGL